MKKISVISLFFAFLLVFSSCSFLQSETAQDEQKAPQIQMNEAAEESAEQSGVVGHFSGSEYSNEFFGLSCTLPQDFTFTDEERLLEILSIGAEFMEEDYAALVADAPLFYDMMAENGKGDSVGVVVENVGGRFSSLDSYVNAAISQIPSALPGSQVNKTEFTIGTQTVPGCEIQFPTEGILIYEKQFYLMKGDYVACVTVGSLDRATTDFLLGLIQVS